MADFDYQFEIDNSQAIAALNDIAGAADKTGARVGKGLEKGATEATAKAKIMKEAFATASSEIIESWGVDGDIANEIGKSLTGALNAATLTAIGIGGAFAGASVAVLAVLKDISGEAAKIERTSRVIGLTAEALQVYERAAEAAGVSTNAIVDGFEKFREKTGGNQRAFEQFIKSLESAAEPAERLRRIQEQLGDASENTKIALLELTDQNGALRKEIEASGGVLSNFEAQDMAQVERRFNSLAISAEGFAKRTTVNLIEGLTQLGVALGEGSDGLDRYEKKQAQLENAAKKTAAALANQINKVETLNDALRNFNVTGVREKFQKEIDAIIKDTVALNEKLTPASAKQLLTDRALLDPAFGAAQKQIALEDTNKSILDSILNPSRSSGGRGGSRSSSISRQLIEDARDLTRELLQTERDREDARVTQLERETKAVTDALKRQTDAIEREYETQRQGIVANTKDLLAAQESANEGEQRLFAERETTLRENLQKQLDLIEQRRNAETGAVGATRGLSAADRRRELERIDDDAKKERTAAEKNFNRELDQLEQERNRTAEQNGQKRLEIERRQEDALIKIRLARIEAENEAEQNAIQQRLERLDLLDASGFNVRTETTQAVFDLNERKLQQERALLQAKLETINADSEEAQVLAAQIANLDTQLRVLGDRLEADLQRSRELDQAEEERAARQARRDKEDRQRTALEDGNLGLLGKIAGGISTPEEVAKNVDFSGEGSVGVGSTILTGLKRINDGLTGTEKETEKSVGKMGRHLQGLGKEILNIGLNWLATGKLSKQGVQALVAATLEGIAQIAFAEALKETAYGLARLAQGVFGDPRGFAASAVHFKSALAWGLVAGVTGAAAGALGGGGDAATAAAAANVGGGGFGGNQVTSTEQEPRQTFETRFNTPQILILRVEDGIIAERAARDIRNRGSLFNEVRLASQTGVL